MTTTKEHLIDLYGKMAEHTAPKCNSISCGRIGKDRCCDSMYCDLAEKIAKEQWNTSLKPTSHPRLKFMGPTGCTVPPHMRPLCTLHQCSINSIGIFPSDKKWNDRYFELRAQIEEHEAELYMEKYRVSTNS